MANLTPLSLLIAGSLILSAGGAYSLETLPDSGAYLAARQAFLTQDLEAEAKWAPEALSADPYNGFLVDSTLIALISSDRFDEAVALAKEVADQPLTRPVVDPSAEVPPVGETSALALMTLHADLAKKGAWEALIASMPDGPAELDVGTLLSIMTRAWAELGAGRATDALALFERASSVRELDGLVDYHRALALTVVGDYESALALLPPVAQAPLLVVVLRIELLSQLDRADEALVALSQLGDRALVEPQLEVLRTRLEAGETLPISVVSDATDGLAQLHLAYASLLATGEAPTPLALVHARLAAWLDPEQTEAQLMVAELLLQAQSLDLADDVVASLTGPSSARPAVLLARIEALARADRIEDALAAALDLTARQPELVEGWLAVGDLNRRLSNYADAEVGYTRALELFSETSGAWFIFYSRGIARERQGNFAGAEEDFRAALELDPERPEVLNYLGYSLLDRNQKLDEALNLIERAVMARPNDGYILDSLAWAYFRLGRYEDAVGPLERAVSLMASDALVNDHMGDVYWMVGRKREARVQWQRALSLDPKPGEDVDPQRIRDKLERGLDAVLSEDGKTDADPASGDSAAAGE